ncbi:uncharacterized protein KY384_002393 [Bacidia gigantensis]|uniref:uncharacterized protein n=1 Tax=Bacidia gigantensis TaxID=2732470 RepID=UPI001D04887C|nr:uncharacterized protein KY384_002393 [Bacidia gigantensis]KAG8532516.1 hypothetical protein KY384_002393 [Bacidia gigantensis]
MAFQHEYLTTVSPSLNGGKAVGIIEAASSQRALAGHIMAEEGARCKSDEYTVGWICALPKEMVAAMTMLDEEYEDISRQDSHDSNNYTLGRIYTHKVVIACLPSGVTGNAPAAQVATQMLRSFKSIKIVLMVGTGGGVPQPQDDIRLGDVVVSEPQGRLGGVVQYDLGKKLVGGKFERTGSLDKPPTVLRSAISKLKAKCDIDDFDLQKFLTTNLQEKRTNVRDQFGRPQAQDELYRADYTHVGNEKDCTRCNNENLVLRSNRKSPTESRIHYGTIASGSWVIKDAATRDKLNKDLRGVKCVEMEAAGLDGFPFLVIRGICDYADSHKNDVWQQYGALTAAAYAKKLLSIIPRKDIVKAEAVVSSPPQPGSALVSQQSTQDLGHSNNPVYRQNVYGGYQGSPELGQSYPQSRRGLTDQLQPGFGPLAVNPGPIMNNPSFAMGKPSEHERALPSDQERSGLGEWSASSSPDLHFQSNGTRRPAPQQRGSPLGQTRPGFGERSAHSSPARNPSSQPPSRQHMVLGSHVTNDPRTMMLGSSSNGPAGVQRKAVTTPKGEAVGYKETQGMAYQQPSRTSAFDHTNHPHQPDLQRPAFRHNDPPLFHHRDPPVPLQTLPKLPHKPRHPQSHDGKHPPHEQHPKTPASKKPSKAHPETHAPAAVATGAITGAAIGAGAASVTSDHEDGGYSSGQGETAHDSDEESGDSEDSDQSSRVQSDHSDNDSESGHQSLHEIPPAEPIDYQTSYDANPAYNSRPSTSHDGLAYNPTQPTYGDVQDSDDVSDGGGGCFGGSADCCGDSDGDPGCCPGCCGDDGKNDENDENNEGCRDQCTVM